MTGLIAEASRWTLRETGGALLGWRDGLNFVIDRVLGPGPRANHGFSYFEPDGEWQVAAGREIYRATGRTVAYLGEWHTHPRSSPTPSRRDQQTARELAVDPDFRSPNLLYVIAGRPITRVFSRGGWKLGTYVWVDDELIPAALRILN